MLSGAKAMIVINNGAGNPITMADSTIPEIPISLPVTTGKLYTVPAVMIRQDDGDAIKAALHDSAITMHLKRNLTIDYDGTLDELVISHEFFHHVSNRSEEHTSELPSLMRISYAVSCLKKKKT